MEGYDIKNEVKPENPKALGVLGYLIVLNNQVHSYEMKALENYLESIETKLEDTCLDAIIRGVEESVSYATSYDAFSNESNDVKICLLHLMYEFNTFSIYQVLPKIIELWGLNMKTDVEAKKNLMQMTGK